MIKLAIGSFVAAIAMFVTGFIFFATPLQFLATGPTLAQPQETKLQAALGANIPATGTYFVPQATTAEGAILYGKGPIATIHYNSGGFSAEDPGVILKGFIQELIICLLLAGALSTLDRRIPDFASRARIVVLFSLAASGLVTLGNPVWYHHDWVYAIYTFIAYAAMLIVAGLVIARWFLPVAAEMPAPSVVKQPQEATSGGEVGTA